MSFYLKKAFSPFFLFSMVLALGATSAASKKAHAYTMDDFSACGGMCMGYGGAMLSPFTGLPQYPMSYGFNGFYPNQPGQMPDYRAQMAQAIAWNGAQPLGTTYMPAVGQTAISNSLAAGALGIN